MRSLFTFIAMLVSLCTLAQNVIGYPYNPDENADAFISTPDLMEFLTVFGYQWDQGEISVDSIPLSTYLEALEALVLANSMPDGNQPGQYLIWNGSSWEPSTNMFTEYVNIHAVDKKHVHPYVIPSGASCENPTPTEQEWTYPAADSILSRMASGWRLHHQECVDWDDTHYRYACQPNSGIAGSQIWYDRCMMQLTFVK